MFFFVLYFPKQRLFCLREEISELENKIQRSFHCSLCYIDRATERSSWDRDSSLVRSCSIDGSDVTEIEQLRLEETDIKGALPIETQSTQVRVKKLAVYIVT